VSAWQTENEQLLFTMQGATQWIMLCVLAQATTVFGISFNVSLASLTNHNTSAYPAYNEANFSANFGTTSWVNQNGSTIAVDPTQMDESLNPITPGHVSKTDVHTLIPSRPDLRWFAHATPWFGTSSHINIGLTNDSATYVAAMITDMKNRGFNGVVIDWYGDTDSTDGVAQKIKSYLSSQPSNTFTYIIMLDGGVKGGTGTNNLQAQIQYCQSQYFSDPNYEHEPVATGLPILMFFGVRSAIGETAMADLKASTGGQMVWVEEGTGYLSESWEDECFEWTDCFTSGVNTSDPFNLAAVTSDYPTIKASNKKAFGAMCGRFNGTLTKSVSWSLGKYLPCSNGLCEVERAASINSAIPNNMTRMQWPTWSDWEEGTQVESGIENDFALSGQATTSAVLSWTITAGDERTISHYEIYASTNGVNAAFLGSVPRSGKLSALYRCRRKTVYPRPYQSARPGGDRRFERSGPDNRCSTAGPDRLARRPRFFHGGGHRDVAFELPVESQWPEHSRSDKLHLLICSARGNERLPSHCQQ
jgi:hypothetical protein